MVQEAVEFDAFDEKTAHGMRGDSEYYGGIPAYLGIRITDAGPGTLTAELDIRPELLNPFGSTRTAAHLPRSRITCSAPCCIPSSRAEPGRPPRSST